VVPNTNTKNVIVGDVGELNVLLGEASSVLVERFPKLLLALAKVPRVAKADVCSLKFPLKTLTRSA
jgi:hypothetical protein